MKSALLVVLVAALSGCAATTSPDVVYRYDAQRMSQVLDATVLSARPVVVQGRDSGAGTVAGGVIGSVAGSSMTGRRDSFAGGVIGAVVGAVVGNAVEHSANRENAVEIVVQLRNGERRAIVQASTVGDAWIPGDPVLLVTSGGRTRVTHAPGYLPPPMSGPVPRS